MEKHRKSQKNKREQSALFYQIHSLSFDYGGNPLPLGGGRSHLKEKY